MNEYSFTLTFALSDPSANGEDYVELLGAAGCDDALIGIGEKGRLGMDFIRESENGLNAILSAVEDVKAVIPDIQLMEASPDYVGLSDIADIIQCSRQNIRKLMVSNIDSFPLPIHKGNISIWHLSPVLEWFETSQGKPVDPAIKEIAEVAMQLNLSKELAQLKQQNNRVSDMLSLFTSNYFETKQLG